MGQIDFQPESSKVGFVPSGPAPKPQPLAEKYRKMLAQQVESWGNPPVVQGGREILSGKFAKGINTELGAVTKALFPAIAVFAPELIPVAAAAPLGTATAVGTSVLAGAAAKHLGYEAGKKMGLTNDQADLAGNVLSLAAAYGGFKGGTVLSKAASNVRAAIADWAQEEPDVAAMKGLGVSPKNKYAARVLKAVNDVRPYMKGVQSQLELEQKIPAVKSQVWKPYADAIEKYGDATVHGPDGPSTLRNLEIERRRLSALNDGVKSKDPVALEKLLQSGKTAAESLQRERSIARDIDGYLTRQGVPAKQIRTRYGSLTELQKRVQGRLGYMVKANYGLGRIMGGARGGGGIGEGGEFSGHGLFLTERLANILPAVNDILAGRPWWEGSPIDIGIKEGFRRGGPIPPTITSAIRGLLPQTIVAEAVPDESFVRGVTAVPEAPEVVRKGRLLPERAGSPFAAPPSSTVEVIPEAERVPGKYAGLLDQQVARLRQVYPEAFMPEPRQGGLQGIAGRLAEIPKGLRDTISRDPKLSRLLMSYLSSPDTKEGQEALSSLQEELRKLFKAKR